MGSCERCEICHDPGTEWCPAGWDGLWWCETHLREHLKVAHKWTDSKIAAEFKARAELRERKEKTHE